MNNVYQNITIEEIPKDILFEGYYWYSNQRKPEVLLSPSIIQQSWFTALPFVIEANFYSKETQLSIQVKNIDGQYHIAKIDLSQLGDIILCEATYIGHDLENYNYTMVEAWLPQEDDLLEGMETLAPAWSAFTGFTNHKTK